MKNFLKENKIPLISIGTVVFLYALFLYVTFTIIQPNTFLTSLDGGILEASPSIQRQENWKPSLIIQNSYSLFSSGVFLSMFASDIEKITAHPYMLKKAERIWPIMEMTFFVIFIILLFTALRKSDSNQRKFIIFLILSILITILMVAIARPDRNVVPDFDYRYAGPPYFFFCIFLVFLIKLFGSNPYVKKLTISIIVIIFALQQIFSFHSLRLKEESLQRKSAIVNFEKTLIEEFSQIENEKGLTIPNLTGAHIFEGMPGYTLSDYLWFFDKEFPIKLVQNKYMPPDVKTHKVETVESLRDSTSEEFVNYLKRKSHIRDYYTQSVRLRVRTMIPDEEKFKDLIPNSEQILSIKKESFDPDILQDVTLLISTDNSAGNIELSFMFDNDFATDSYLGKIRIDDYTPFKLSMDNKRLYEIKVNLSQIYVFALSKNISNLNITVPKEKNTKIYEAKIQEKL